MRGDLPGVYADVQRSLNLPLRVKQRHRQRAQPHLELLIVKRVALLVHALEFGTQLRNRINGLWGIANHRDPAQHIVQLLLRLIAQQYAPHRGRPGGQTAADIEIDGHNARAGC